MPSTVNSAASPPGLLVRADAGAGMGAGHVMRCLALAHEWRARGGDVRFLGRMGDALAARIAGDGYALTPLDVEPFGDGDVQRTLDALAALGSERGGTPWCVLDGYGFEPRHQEAVRAAGNRLLVVDDRAHLSRYTADVILNHNPDAPERPYTHDGARTLLGLRYALLRPEFAAAGRSADSGQQPPPRALRVLVTMGGADDGNMCALALGALSRVAGAPLEVTVVAGSANPRLEALREAAAGLQHAVTVAAHVDDMAGLMRRTDLAVTAAGGTCWELSRMGVPMVLVVTADNQVGVAAGVEAAGAGVLAGTAGEIDPGALGAMVASIAADAPLREAMSRSGRRLVDGRGPERVVDAMLEITRTTTPPARTAGAAGSGARGTRTWLEPEA